MLADPDASHRAQAEVQRELALLGDASPDVAQQVGALLQRASGTLPTLEAAARQLCMSDRSLKRKLQTAGTSFQKLLNETLLQRTLQLMRNAELDLQDIAQQLGYQDPESFTRAFRRWTGQTPSQYRLRLLSPPAATPAGMPSA